MQANESSKLVLVDLWAPTIIDLTTTDRMVKRQVESELLDYIHAGATDAQIQRETIRRYRRVFYTPDMVATWRLCMDVQEHLSALYQQGYHVIFFGEHLQRGYSAIEHWCQEHLPGVPFSLALNDLPFYVEEENVFLLGTRQEMYEQAGWAFCLILTLIRLYRATHVFVVTHREQVQEHYERAKERGDVPLLEIEIFKDLKDLK